MFVLFLAFIFLLIPRPQRSTLFPYTTLFRSNLTRVGEKANYDYLVRWVHNARERTRPYCPYEKKDIGPEDYKKKGDRKSTRLNSSHTVISYAVFCLKKKKKKQKKKTKKHN